MKNFSPELRVVQGLSRQEFFFGFCVESGSVPGTDGEIGCRGISFERGVVWVRGVGGGARVERQGEEGGPFLPEAEGRRQRSGRGGAGKDLEAHVLQLRVAGPVRDWARGSLAGLEPQVPKGGRRLVELRHSRCVWLLFFPMFVAKVKKMKVFVDTIGVFLCWVLLFQFLNI